MDIQLPQILFQIINFSVVAGALTYLLYKPILKILDERAKKIEEAQQAAEATIAQKNKLQELEKETLEKAGQEAATILENARSSAKQTHQEASEQAAQKAAASLEKLKEGWEDEKKQHLADMKKTFVSSVIATASKVVEAELDAKKHQKLIDAQLEALLKAI